MPTIDEQLAGALRLLNRIEDTCLTPENKELAQHVRRLLGHVVRSWADEPNFHAADNTAMTALLSALAPSGVAPVVPGEARGARELAALNMTLRGHLAAAAVALPDTDAGRDARATIARHLLRRLESDPTWRGST